MYEDLERQEEKKECVPVKVFSHQFSTPMYEEDELGDELKYISIEKYGLNLRGGMRHDPVDLIFRR